MAGNSKEAGRSVASKISLILRAFTEGGEHSLTEIAALAGLPISTAHRLVHEMTSWNLLERTEAGLYRAGLPVRMVGARAVCASSISQCGRYILEDLVAATQHRARLGVLDGLEVAYIEKQPGRKPVTHFCPAATLPLHATALGRALLAYMEGDTIERVITRGLRAYTPNTIISPDRFRRALAITRMTRVAITRWELEPATSGIAMPVFGPGGRVAAAIELVVRDPSHELQRFIPLLSIATRSLSRQIIREHELLPDAAPIQRHFDPQPLVALTARAVS